jgi:ElaB/YqjD/DUF883 family membrane-anchored ribosome-binding protein
MGDLSDAIKKLETAAKSNGNGKPLFADEIDAVKKALAEIKPQFENIKNNVQSEAKEYAQDIDKQVRENPWWAIGIVGVILFLIGFLLGRKD